MCSTFSGARRAFSALFSGKCCRTCARSTKHIRKMPIWVWRWRIVGINFPPPSCIKHSAKCGTGTYKVCVRARLFVYELLIRNCLSVYFGWTLSSSYRTNTAKQPNHKHVCASISSGTREIWLELECRSEPQSIASCSMRYMLPTFEAGARADFMCSNLVFCRAYECSPFDDRFAACR